MNSQPTNMERILDQALSTDEGISIQFASREEARKFSMRLYMARQRDRMKDKLARKVERGQSLYDCLAIRIIDNPDGTAKFMVFPVRVEMEQLEIINIASGEKIKL